MSLKLVILAGQAGTLKQAEQYLRNRQWTVVCADNIKDALEQAARINADFVLVSADHPDRSIRDFPRLLKQVCPSACLLGSIENSSQSAINTLTAMHLDYVVYPPVSGPEVERIAMRAQEEARESDSFVTDWNIPEELPSLFESYQAREKKAAVEEAPSEIYVYEAPLPDQESVFAKVTQSALDESVTFANGMNVEPLGVNNRYACVVVKSEQYSGYLIAALGCNREPDLKLINNIKDRIFEALKDEGIVIAGVDAIQVELENVSLEDWAFQEARFFSRSVHNEREIAIAFFQGEQKPFELLHSEVDLMFKMRIEDLEEHSDLDFDLYIFLPTNSRLLLYTPNGRRVERSQKARLQERGITHLHLRKESQPLMERYFTRARLNEKILSFRERSREF